MTIEAFHKLKCGDPLVIGAACNGIWHIETIKRVTGIAITRTIIKAVRRVGRARDIMTLTERNCDIARHATPADIEGR